MHCDRDRRMSTGIPFGSADQFLQGFCRSLMARAGDYRDLPNNAHRIDAFDATDLVEHGTIVAMMFRLSFAL